MAKHCVVSLKHLPLRPSRVLLWWWMFEVSCKVWGSPGDVWRGVAYAVLVFLAVTVLAGVTQQQQLEPVFKEK